MSTPTTGLFGFVNQLQLGPGLTRGFVVDATSPTPTLTLGLEQSLAARFASQFPMNPGTGGGYGQFLVNSNMTLSGPGSSPAIPLVGVPTLFDTGHPLGPIIFTGNSVSIDPSLTTTNFWGTFLKEGITMDFALGNVTQSWMSDGFNIEVSTTNGTGGVLLGLPFFDSYAVMYDVENGVVGFASSDVPEIDPAGMGSVLALVAGTLGLVERRRPLATRA